MKGAPARTDPELVAEVATGNSDALAELYDRHADAIYRAAYRRVGDRHAAEEILQDTFLALWNRAELFDESQGSLRAWLGTIARNRSIDRLRASGRRPSPAPLSGLADDDDDERVMGRISQEALVASGTRPVDPELEADRTEVRRAVLVALAAMPDSERRALEMAYFEDLTQSEIAARLGWPIGTVKTRTRRGLFRLRAVLADVMNIGGLAPEERHSANASDEDDSESAFQGAPATLTTIRGGSSDQSR
jgi:RNA polymerase sigma-70 factor (ECF subfamily)